MNNNTSRDGANSLPRSNTGSHHAIGQSNTLQWSTQATTSDLMQSYKNFDTPSSSSTAKSQFPPTMNRSYESLPYSKQKRVPAATPIVPRHQHPRSKSFSFSMPSRSAMQKTAAYNAAPKESVFQEKMFLPNTCSNLDEGLLRQSLLSHLSTVKSKTGMEVQLRGGIGTNERIHFYVSHSNEVNFNEGKKLIIKLVQTVVSRMQQRKPTTAAQDKADDVILIDVDNTAEEERERVTLTPCEQKQHLIQNAISKQKEIIGKKIQQVSKVMMKSAEDSNQSTVIMSDLEGPEVVVLDDDKPLTKEELELQKQLQQLKKCNSILECAGVEPGKLPEKVMPKKKVEKPVNDRVDAFLLAYSKKVTALEARAARGVPLIDATHQRTLNGSVASSTVNTGPVHSRSAIFDDRVAPAPPPLIDPSLDYLYNPSVVESIHKTLEFPAKGKENTVDKNKKLSMLQVGYLPDTEYGEQPYSECLIEENKVNNYSEQNPISVGRESINICDKYDKAHDRYESAQQTRFHHRHYRVDSRRSLAMDYSHHHRMGKLGKVTGEGVSDISSKMTVAQAHRSHHRHNLDESNFKEKPRFDKDRSLDLREKEYELRERKEREERRLRYEAYERKGQYELFRKEREKWERAEMERKKKVEREKSYIPESEIECYERYERARRERFEEERRHWVQRETEKMKKEIQEEIEAEEEAKLKGRVGPPVVYVSNVSPVTIEATLHNHFSMYGQVVKVLLIRTRIKNILQAEVYFEKWAHTRRAIRAPPGAHVVDGYPIRVTYESIPISGPITRMDEYKVKKKEESFDEILLKYKMQSEMKYGRKSGGSNILPPPPGTESIPVRPVTCANRRNTYRKLPSSTVIDLTTESSAGTIHKPTSATWSDVKGQKKNFRHNEYEMELQKKMFSGSMNVEKDELQDDRPRKVVLLLDSSMPYYNEDLAEQCRYQIVKEESFDVCRSHELLQSQWHTEKKHVLKTDGTFTCQVVYVVMSSTSFVVKSVAGDCQHISPLDLTADYEPGGNIAAKLLLYITTLAKYLKRINYSDNKFNTIEMKLWIELLNEAEANIDAFVNSIKNDLTSLRHFLELKRRKQQSITSLLNDGLVKVKEEHDPNLEIIVEGDFDGDNIKSSDGNTKDATVECNSIVEDDGNALNLLIELIGEQLKKAQCTPVVIDLEEGEETENEDSNFQNRDRDSKNNLTKFLMRRLLFECFQLHEIVHIKDKVKVSREDKSIVFTNYSSKWLNRTDIKKSIQRIKQLGVIKTDEEVQSIVSSVLQVIKLFNCLSRASWALAGCSKPLLYDLKDAIREEGEVEEEGEIIDTDEELKEDGRRRRQSSRSETKERRKLEEEKRRVEKEKKKIEKQRKELENMKKNMEEDKKQKELEIKLREEEEEKRLAEMEELKKKLQAELAFIGVDLEDEHFDDTDGKSKESLKENDIIDDDTAENTQEKGIEEPSVSGAHQEHEITERISSKRLPTLFLLQNKTNRDIFQMPEQPLPLPNAPSTIVDPSDNSLPTMFGVGRKKKKKKKKKSRVSTENVPFGPEPESVGAAAPRSVGAAAPRSVGATAPRSVGAAAPRSVGAAVPKSVGTAKPVPLALVAPQMHFVGTQPISYYDRIMYQRNIHQKFDNDFASFESSWDDASAAQLPQGPLPAEVYAAARKTNRSEVKVPAGMIVKRHQIPEEQDQLINNSQKNSSDETQQEDTATEKSVPSEITQIEGKSAKYPEAKLSQSGRLAMPLHSLLEGALRRSQSSSECSTRKLGTQGQEKYLNESNTEAFPFPPMVLSPEHCSILTKVCVADAHHLHHHRSATYSTTSVDHTIQSDVNNSNQSYIGESVPVSHDGDHTINDGQSNTNVFGDVITTSTSQSTYSSLKRHMNAQKKLSKAEIKAMIVKCAPVSEPHDDVTSDAAAPHTSTTLHNTTTPAVSCDALVNTSHESISQLSDNNDTLSWFSSMQNMWDVGHKTQMQFSQNKKPRKPRKKNYENDLMRAACSLAPENRIGPNADQWRADEEEYMKTVSGKRARENDDIHENVVNKKAKGTKKKLIPIPYRRYVLENDPFREFLYNYKHKATELNRKLQQLKKQKRDSKDSDANSNMEETELNALLTKVSLRKVSLNICSFVVRVTLSPMSMHVKWAQDIAHAFGFQFAPMKDTLSDAWLYPSNEADDAAAMLAMLKNVRLVDAEIQSVLHYAAAPIPKLLEESKQVLRQRFLLFMEKYDNTEARNMQQRIENGDSCSFFRSDWRNAYVSGLKELYSTVADTVRSLAKKQTSGGRKWCSEEIRVVVVVADVKAAVWCGALVGSIAGKKGVSLVGGEELRLSDVEHADVVIGTPEQLLPLLSRPKASQSMDADVCSSRAPQTKHPLNGVLALILDDVHVLMEQEAAKEFVSVVQKNVKKKSSLEVVAVARRVRFDELEKAERIIGCKFPRTALDEPATGEDLNTAVAMEEQLWDALSDKDNDADAPDPTMEDKYAATAKLNEDLKRNRIQTGGKNSRQSKIRAEIVRGNVPPIEKVEEKKRQREEEQDPEPPPMQQLSFMDELDRYRTEQKIRRMEEGIDEESVKKQKRDMERKMAYLREEQKKRQEHERRAAWEKKIRERQDEEMRKQLSASMDASNNVPINKDAIEEKTDTIVNASCENEQMTDQQQSTSPSLTEHPAMVGSPETDKNILSEEQLTKSSENLAAKHYTDEIEDKGKEPESRASTNSTETKNKSILTSPKELSGKEEEHSSQKHKKDACGVSKKDELSFNEKKPSTYLDRNAERIKSDRSSKSFINDKGKPDKSGSRVSSKDGKKSGSSKAKTAEQLKKQEQRRLLEEEKRRLEQRIQQEILRRQKSLQSEEVQKEEKARKLLQDKLYQQQLLLQNKLLQEKKKRKIAERESEQAS